MKALKYAALFLSIGSAQAMAQTPGVTDSEIVLGAVLPMSGPVSFPGVGSLAGSRLAIAEFNEKGGIHGRTVRLLVEDDGYVPSRSYQGLVKLIDDGIFALIGTSGGGGLAAMLPVIDENKLPTMVSTSVSNAAVEPLRPYIFMLGADYEDMFYAQIKYISENDKPEGAYAVITQDDDYGAHVEAGFLQAVEQLGLPSVPPVRFKRGQKDFAAEVLRLRSQNIGALAVGGVILETPGVLKELARLKLNIPTAHPHTGAIEMTAKLSAPYQMDYYAADYVVPISSDAAADFRELASKHLSEDEMKGLNRFSLTGYLGTKAVLVAAEACGIDLTRECFNESLKKINNLDTAGLSAPLDFTNERNTAARELQVVRVKPVEGVVEPVTEFVSYR